MDTAIEQIFKVFNHIVRELQVYFTSGILVLSNIYVIDFFYYNCSLFNTINQKQFLIPAIIITYVIGHICMAFFYILLEWRGLDKKLNKLMGFSYIIKSSVLPSIYKKDKEAYVHFIERYIVLSMMRWNFSAAFFINFLIDLSFTIFIKYYWQVVLLTTLSLVVSFIMFVLTSKTEKDYAGRIQSMENL